MWSTLIAYLIGYLVGTRLSTDAITRSSLLLAAFTVTAFVVSFKHAFASLARTEGWQKTILQYMPPMIFGIFTPPVWHEAGITGFIVLVCSGSIHVASWNNSSDSRKYRLEQFKLGFADHWPDHARIIAILNSEGRSEAADDVVKSVISGSREKMTESCTVALKHLSDDQKGLLRKDYLLR